MKVAPPSPSSLPIHCSVLAKFCMQLYIILFQWNFSTDFKIECKFYARNKTLYQWLIQWFIFFFSTWKKSIYLFFNIISFLKLIFPKRCNFFLADTKGFCNNVIKSKVRTCNVPQVSLVWDGDFKSEGWMGRVKTKWYFKMIFFTCHRIRNDF